MADYQRFVFGVLVGDLVQELADGLVDYLGAGFTTVIAFRKIRHKPVHSPVIHVGAASDDHHLFPGSPQHIPQMTGVNNPCKSQGPL